MKTRDGSEDKGRFYVLQMVLNPSVTADAVPPPFMAREASRCRQNDTQVIRYSFHLIRQNPRFCHLPLGGEGLDGSVSCKCHAGSLPRKYI